MLVVARVGVFWPGSWLIGEWVEPLLLALSCSLLPVVAFVVVDVVGAARYVGGHIVEGSLPWCSSSWKGGKRVDVDVEAASEKEGAVL